MMIEGMGFLLAGSRRLCYIGSWILLEGSWSAMKYRGIRKICEGRFITRYDVDYETAEGRSKTYEIISRWRICKTRRRIPWS